MKGSIPSRLQKRMNRNIVHRKGTYLSASWWPRLGLAISLRTNVSSDSKAFHHAPRGKAPPGARPPGPKPDAVGSGLCAAPGLRAVRGTEQQGHVQAQCEQIPNREPDQE